MPRPSTRTGSSCTATQPCSLPAAQNTVRSLVGGMSDDIVVQLADGQRGDAALAAELIAFAKSRLPGFKTPRSIDFVVDLPRLPSGKIQRRLVRAPYWAGRAKQI